MGGGGGEGRMVGGEGGGKEAGRGGKEGTGGGQLGGKTLQERVSGKREDGGP